MKKMLLCSFLLLYISLSLAQTVISYKKRPTLGVNFSLTDFTTADLARRTSLGSVINNKNWSRIKDMSAGLGLQYLEGLNGHVDFSGRLNATFVNYLFQNKPASSTASKKVLVEADASLNIKLLSDKYFLSPYISAGVGASMYSVYFAAYAPVGAGLQFNLGKGDAFMFTTIQYLIPVTDLSNYHFNYSFGFAGALTAAKETKLLPPPPPPAPSDSDSDSDGVADAVDKCPNVKGLAAYNGCPVPDSDNDSINDEEDKCPTVAGIAKYNGCPIPDTDNDGVNDEEDKCLAVAGVARYNGCPIPDTDNDGVNDEEDKCPGVAGPAGNNGCPEKAKQMQAQVDVAARQIYFATGSATLLSKSSKPLNEIVTLLKTNDDLALDIEGHTDNTGSAAINLKLSQKRADAVLKYLKNKSINASQITAKGYGPDVPVADNKTAAGRAQNRRVELKLKQL